MIDNKVMPVFETLEHYWEITPYVFRVIHRPPQEPTRHFIHKELTFVFVLNGKMKINLNGKDYFFESGDLACINTYTPHAQERLLRTEYVRIIIDTKFLLYNGFDPTSVIFDEFIHDENIKKMFFDMIFQFRNQDELYKITMNSLVLQFISYVAKKYSHENEHSNKNQHYHSSDDYKYIGVALNYISTNFKDNITLDELSNISGLSKSHFLKLFKKCVGTSPINYISNVRCSYAKQLILNGTNITQAAFDSGFSSTSYFTLCFKKHKGCLPSEVTKLSKI